MHFIIRATFCCLLLLIINTAAFSQSFKDRYFSSIGWTAILDVFQLPSYSTTDSPSGIYNEVDNLFGLSFVTYAYKSRLNIYNIDENTSVDIHLTPALGFSYAADNDISYKYLGSISIPLMAGLNFGNVATYETEKNVGFGIALGYEYFNGGLIRIGEASGVSKPKRSVFEPVVELNLRYWSKANFAKEISLLAGFGSKNAADIDYSNPANPPIGSIKGSFHFRLMWSTYINY